jgi:hypothetical protein
MNAYHMGTKDEFSPDSRVDPFLQVHSAKAARHNPAGRTITLGIDIVSSPSQY